MNIVQMPGEALKIRHDMKSHIDESDVNGDVRRRLYAIAGNRNVAAAGLIGYTLYDVAQPPTFSRADRRSVGADGALTICLQDIVDTVVNEDMVDADIADKSDYLDAMSNLLLYGMEPARSYVGGSLRERTSRWLAADFYDRVSSTDNAEVFVNEARTLNAAVQEQFFCDEPDRMLTIAETIGSSCVGMVGGLVAAKVPKKSRQDAMRAAHVVGAYGQILDHLYEIGDDLNESSRTYATLRIWDEGDSAAVRKDIKTIMLLRAEQTLAKGLAPFNRRQQKSITSITRLLHLKYGLKGLTGR